LRSFWHPCAVTEYLVPDWAAAQGVRALSTTRLGGASSAPWAGFNLGEHVGDDAAAVLANRRQLRQLLPEEPRWLSQVHGRVCVDAAQSRRGETADASFTRQRGVVCAVLTADCLPVLLCDERASVVGIAHAGWRGLAAGVVEATVAAMDEPGGRLMAWLGPAIGPQAFEVGSEVRETFLACDSAAAAAFVAAPDGKWLCDIYLLARQRLRALGIRRITGADFCTVGDPRRFYSYRRDGSTGRMARLIWLE
jgi:YfiH family protein